MSPSPPLPLLKRLFEAAGYRVEVRPEALVAVRPDDHRAVVVDRGRRSPRELEPLFAAGTVHRTVVYELDPGAEARADASELGLEVLEATALGPALGELLLPATRTDAPVEGGGEPADLDAPFPLLPGESRTVRPRIDRSEAELRAGMRDARYTLRLIPYFVAAYRLRTVAADGGPGPVTHRLAAVNAVTKSCEIWEEGARELVEEASVPAQKLLPRFGDAAATSLALDAVRRHHAGRVDHTEQHSGALVIESRRVLPPLRDVRLGPMSLLYVPFWYAEGSAGRVVLDAVTGLSASMPDPAEGLPLGE